MEPLEAKLKDMIIDRYGSLAKFASEIDMSWTTLDSILKRGILKANIVNVLKITGELGIDTEKLGEGLIVSLSSKDSCDVSTIAAHHDNEDWTKEELEEIENFKKYVKSKRR